MWHFHSSFIYQYSSFMIIINIIFLLIYVNRLTLASVHYLTSNHFLLISNHLVVNKPPFVLLFIFCAFEVRKGELLKKKMEEKTKNKFLYVLFVVVTFVPPFY